VGARRFTRTRRSWKDITAPLLSACSGTSMLLKCDFLRAKDIPNGSLGCLLWSLLWAEKSLASQAKKPVAAINLKAVYSKPSTPYDRPFGVREKMAPLRSGELEGGGKRATDPIWSLKVHHIEKPSPHPMNQFCFICTMGPNVASFANSCLSCLPTPSFRRLRDDIREARQSLQNLETTPSADLSSRRYHSLCTSRSYAFPKRRSACHTNWSPKLEYLGKQCLLWILIAVTPVLRDFVHEERENFLRNIINGSVNSCNFQTMVEIPFQQRHLKHDLLGWKGANQFSLLVHGFAFAVRQVVFHVLRYSLAWNGFVVKQGRHFFELRP